MTLHPPHKKDCISRKMFFFFLPTSLENLIAIRNSKSKVQCSCMPPFWHQFYTFSRFFQGLDHLQRFGTPRMSGHLSILKRFLRNLQRHPELGCRFHMAQLQHLHQQVWYFLKLDIVREGQPRLQMPGTRGTHIEDYGNTYRFWHSCGWKKLCPIWLYLLVNWDSQKALLEPLSQQVGPYLTLTARNFSVIMCLSWQVFFKVTGQLRYVACKAFPPMAAEAQPRETRGGGSWPCLFSRPILLRTPSTALAALSWHSVWRIAPRDVASFAASGLWTNRSAWECKVLQEAASASQKNGMTGMTRWMNIIAMIDSGPSEIVGVCRIWTVTRKQT